MNKSAFENHPHLPIAIVGGGLGGLALAIGLIRQGVKVHIYESSSAYSEIGAGLTFGTNATKALHLIDPRLLRGFMKHATFNDNPERDNTFCTVVWGMDEKRPGGRKAGDFAFHHEHKGHYEGELDGIGTKGRIHRARLLEEMVALLPEDITSFNKSFVGVQDTGHGMLQLSFADGTRALASAVIGCDGIKSKVRHHVCGPDVQPKYAGECAFRALVPGDEARAMLGEERALNCQLYSGYGAYIVTYPVEHGRFVNMIAIPQDELTGRVEQDTWTWTAPTSADEIRERFRSWYPPLIELIARHHLPSKWALYTVQHDSTYFKNRICLLGDSAHATTPHLGAGAGMSLEDAYILSHLVASAGSTANIEAAFRAYDAVRRPRTQECVKRSLNVAQIYDLAFENVGDDMVKIKKLLEDNYKWLWDEDLEAQLLTAKNLLQRY